MLSPMDLCDNLLTILPAFMLPPHSHFPHSSPSEPPKTRKSVSFLCSRPGGGSHLTRLQSVACRAPRSPWPGQATCPPSFHPSSSHPSHWPCCSLNPGTLLPLGFTLPVPSAWSLLPGPSSGLCSNVTLPDRPSLATLYKIMSPALHLFRVTLSACHTFSSILHLSPFYYNILSFFFIDFSISHPQIYALWEQAHGSFFLSCTLSA